MSGPPLLRNRPEPYRGHRLSQRTRRPDGHRTKTPGGTFTPFRVSEDIRPERHNGRRFFINLPSDKTIRHESRNHHHRGRNPHRPNRRYQFGMDSRKAERSRVHRSAETHRRRRPARDSRCGRGSHAHRRRGHRHRRSRSHEGRHHETDAGRHLRRRNGTRPGDLRTQRPDTRRTRHRVQRAESGAGDGSLLGRSTSEHARYSTGHVVHPGRQGGRLPAGRSLRDEGADGDGSDAAASRTLPSKQGRTPHCHHLRTGRIGTRGNDSGMGGGSARLPSSGLPSQPFANQTAPLGLRYRRTTGGGGNRTAVQSARTADTGLLHRLR